MLYSCDSGILRKGQLYWLVIMVNLGEVVDPVQLSVMARRANSRMSSTTLPVASILGNAHMHKLLFKCAKTCSKSGQEDTYVVLPICVTHTNQFISDWLATLIYKKRAVQECLVRLAGAIQHGNCIEFQIFGQKLKKVI